MNNVSKKVIFYPNNYREKLHVKFKSHDLNLILYAFKDGYVSYSSFRRYGGCYGCGIEPNDNFNIKEFRSNLASAYFLQNHYSINLDLLNYIVKTMVDYINDARREQTVTATIWVGQQIRREWKDLLPYVAEMLDQRG